MYIFKVNRTFDKYLKSFGSWCCWSRFKRITQKIFTDSPSTFEIKGLNKKNTKQENQYNSYYLKTQNEKNRIPNVKGMAGMDAVALLENMGLKVKLKKSGIGKVISQSILVGQPIVRNSIIELELN
jgi:cell division protein FtsI (penicillin-binding protein 3)